MRASLIVSTIAGFAASTALAQDYYNQAAFQAAALGGGRTLQCTEDFQEATPGYFIVGIAEPLTQNVANGPYASGIRCPLSLQSNLMGDGGLTTQPRGGSQPLAAVEGGVGLSATDSVVANYFVDGMDIIPNGSFSAIGFNPMAYSGSDNVLISIFDTANNLLGTFKSGANSNETDYFGYVSNAAIGRINIFGLGGNAEGGDNIELWAGVPAPSTAALLGLGGLVAGRRRRA